MTDQKPLKKSKAWYWATLGFAGEAVASIFLIAENDYPLVYVRYALVIIFLLGLPGYALLKALFPIDFSNTNASQNIDTEQKVAVSVALSLVLVSTVALAMNYTPLGMDFTSIILVLFSLTLIFATIGVVRAR